MNRTGRHMGRHQLNILVPLFETGVIYYFSYYFINEKFILDILVLVNFDTKALGKNLYTMIFLYKRI